MMGEAANDCTAQQLIDVAQWLIAEKTFHTNYIHASMYRKQMELTSQLCEAQKHSEHLAAANTELQERVATLTEAYAALFGEAMNLAEIKQYKPTTFHNSDPQWCARVVAAICRSE